MNGRQRQDRVNGLKFYIVEGEFRRDVWRVFIPVFLVGAVIVWSCLA